MPRTHRAPVISTGPLTKESQMPKLGAVVSHIVITSAVIALVFRVDFMRSLVTGIQVSTGAGAPAAGKALYL